MTDKLSTKSGMLKFNRCPASDSEFTDCGDTEKSEMKRSIFVCAQDKPPLLTYSRRCKQMKLREKECDDHDKKLKRKNPSPSHGNVELAKKPRMERVKEKVAGKVADIYELSDFITRDIVWAKCWKRHAAWPAVVIKPSEAPESVLRARAANTLCVMFYGFTSCGKREFGWIKAGMIFPFQEYKERFQGQTKLCGRKQSDFREAIAEAVSNENHYWNSSKENGEKTLTVENFGDAEETTGLNQVSEYRTQQASSNWANNSTRLSERPENEEAPDRIIVVCNGVEGKYNPTLHMVQCICGSCGTDAYRIGQWEQHTGCRSKKWKQSVKVKGSNLTLEKWMAEQNVNYLKPMWLNGRQLIVFLEANYEPVCPNWTGEKCAICRWVEDWEHNRIIVCNRCQIAVHQECYGARNTQDFTLWVCRACETPKVEKECCLCPVKGGALKPTDINDLWVHVTCAWLCPEVAFLSPEKMEPAVGILSIPTSSFTMKCTICKQIHGSCTRCCKCDTYFHATCASLAGFYMELKCYEKDGVEMSKWTSYCDVHRTSRLDNVLVMQTPDGIFSNKSLYEGQFLEQCSSGSETISTRTYTCSDSSPGDDAIEFEAMSSARCRIYKRSDTKSAGIEPVFHRLMGPRHHSLDEIESVSSHHEETKGVEDKPTFSKRLERLEIAGKYRVCFGKSGIHGWGLFAKRSIEEGEMVIEYLGERVRNRISDLREARYMSEGKDCYFLRTSEGFVIDATNKGNIARLINHSCMPNCYTRILDMDEEEKRIVFIAKTSVKAGDELTYDYQFNPGEVKIPCLCKAPNCKKFLS